MVPEISITPKGMSFEIQRVEGVSIVVVFKGMSKAKLEILEGWGGVGVQTNPLWEGDGYFLEQQYIRTPYSLTWKSAICYYRFLNVGTINIKNLL